MAAIIKLVVSCKFLLRFLRTYDVVNTHVICTNDNEMTMTMKYFILTEKQCNIINQKCIKLKYCHGDHIKKKKLSIAYDHQCC